MKKCRHGKLTVSAENTEINGATVDPIGVVHKIYVPGRR